VGRTGLNALQASEFRRPEKLPACGLIRCLQPRIPPQRMTFLKALSDDFGETAKE